LILLFFSSATGSFFVEPREKNGEIEFPEKKIKIKVLVDAILINYSCSIFGFSLVSNSRLLRKYFSVAKSRFQSKLFH
jgi:hypothetical protein